MKELYNVGHETKGILSFDTASDSNDALPKKLGPEKSSGKVSKVVSFPLNGLFVHQ
jgi:hypothetical protein